MRTNVYILVDYKNKFSSNYGGQIYRGGLNHDSLENAFSKYGMNIIWKTFSEIDFTNDWSGKIVLYTSSEDNKILYKSYIEDIIYGLELHGAVVIPKFKYLRAHHNKVFMEILRSKIDSNNHSKSLLLGTLEESIDALKANKITFPCVIKAAAGAMSKAVAKATNKKEFIAVVSDMSKTPNLKLDVKDFLRTYKHKGYIPESTHRNKFIVQPMIQGLENDWKVLVYGDKIFNLKRFVRKNDFRASGSHVNYKIGSESGLTSEMMDFVFDIYKKMDIPMLSFDLAYDGKNYYMIEFQTLYFGTSTFALSKDYYERVGSEWVLKPKDENKLEMLFAYAINKYICEHKR
ncbi:hypothetical protein [uncultured Bacteroides sp.]|uniref:hypothetical protein n=1 Tax=uncultured Bacteroides sp. TaxID=162156 RepID=UPI002AA668A3|nr:hypothetical protein [uncultured Bacteroides sp.]